MFGSTMLSMHLHSSSLRHLVRDEVSCTFPDAGALPDPRPTNPRRLFRQRSFGNYLPKRSLAVAVHTLDVMAIGRAMPSLIDLQAGKRTWLTRSITKRVGEITLCSKGFRSFGIYPAAEYSMRPRAAEIAVNYGRLLQN